MKQSWRLDDFSSCLGKIHIRYNAISAIFPPVTEAKYFLNYPIIVIHSNSVWTNSLGPVIFVRFNWGSLKPG